MTGAAPSADARPWAAIVYNPVKIDLGALRGLVKTQESRSEWAPTRWFETSESDPGRGAAERALAAGPSVVIAVGGDGTVRAAAEAVHASGVPLALVPTGTGNLLARTLGLHSAGLEQSVKTAFTGSDRRIDAASIELRHTDQRISRHLYLVMAGLGLDAEMAAHTNPRMKRWFGWAAYIDPILRSVGSRRQLHLHYRLDGARTRSVRAHTVIVGNCGLLPGNLVLIPDAVLDDGLLDVVVLRPRGLSEWIRIASRLSLVGLLRRAGAERMVTRITPEDRALQYVRVRNLEVRLNTPHEVELDGDSFGPVSGARVQIEPRGLTIRVPANSDDAVLA